jgi:hypothetical protein
MGLLSKVKKVAKKAVGASIGLATGGLLGAAGKMLKAGAAQQAGTAAAPKEYGTASVKNYLKARHAKRITMRTAK